MNDFINNKKSKISLGQKVRFKRIDSSTDVNMKYSSKKSKVKTGNISASGLFLYTDNAPPINSTCEVEIFENDATKPITGTISIVRIEYDVEDMTKVIGVGAEFEKFNLNNRDKLNKLLLNNLNDSLFKKYLKSFYTGWNTSLLTIIVSLIMGLGLTTFLFVISNDYGDYLLNILIFISYTFFPFLISFSVSRIIVRVFFPDRASKLLYKDFIDKGVKKGILSKSIELTQSAVFKIFDQNIEDKSNKIESTIILFVQLTIFIFLLWLFDFSATEIKSYILN